MKASILFISTLFIGFLSCAEEIIKDSKIKNVTVFLKGAQVNRQAKFSASAGVSEIIISGVSQFVDPKSIQIKGTNGIIILDSKFTSYYLSPEEQNITKLPKDVRVKIADKEDSVQQINYQIIDLNAELDVYKASKSIILNNGAMRGQGKVNDSIQLLQEAVEYYLDRVTKLNKEINSLTRRINQLESDKQAIQSRLANLRNYSNNDTFKNRVNSPDYRIVVTVSSEKAVTGFLDLTYLVSNAGWTAQYDLKSDAGKQEINLNYKAQVYQNTGVDWNNIRLSVSTNDPYLNKTKPELVPWVLGMSNKVYQNQRQLQTQSLSISRGVVKDQVAEPMLEDAELNFDYATSAQHTRVIQHIISAEFKIDLPYTIKSNGQQHMVLVKNEDVDANFIYYSVPKLENSAYLVAQITNLEELQLIPAKANIFFDGSYMGETYLNPGIMDDTLSLSLGKDPNIIVKRTFMKKNYKEKIIGNEVEKTSHYQIEILNNKGNTIKLIIQDQVPVSRTEDIKVLIEEISKGELKETSGLVKWKIKLKSKEREKLDLMYTVKHKKNEPLVLR